MKVKLSHTLYWGGPNHGSIAWEEWPFGSIPKVGEYVFIGEDHTTGVESFCIHQVYWVTGENYIELRTKGDLGENQEAALERITWLRKIGFDYGPLYRWEKEEKEECI